MSIPRVLAKLCRFYGWTDADLMELTMAKLKMYADQVVHLEKEEARMGLAISTSPHTKESEQRKLHHALRETGKASSNQRGKSIADIDPRVIEESRREVERKYCRGV